MVGSGENYVGGYDHLFVKDVMDILTIDESRSAKVFLKTYELHSFI